MTARVWRYILAAGAVLISYQAAAIAQDPGDGGGQGDIASSDRSFDEIHAAYLDETGLQLERPVEALEVNPPRNPSGFWRFLADLLSAMGPLFQVIFYGGLAAIVGGVLYFIVTQVTDFRFNWQRGDKRGPTDDVLETLRPDADAARSLLAEADALAREGRFGEAVHLLLFRSIEDIQSRRKMRLSEALTAREIGDLSALPAAPRRALQPIIRLVERNFFGGRALAEADWQSARQSYETFAFGEAWG